MARHSRAQASRLAASFRSFANASLVNILAGSRNLAGIDDTYSYTDTSVARRLTPIAVVVAGAGTSIIDGIDLKTNGAYQIAVTGNYADWNGSGTNDWYLYTTTPRAPITTGGITYTAFDVDQPAVKFATTNTGSGGTFAYSQQHLLETSVYVVGFDMVAGTSQENLGFDLTITITPIET